MMKHSERERESKQDSSFFLSHHNTYILINKNNFIISDNKIACTGAAGLGEGLKSLVNLNSLTLSLE